MLAIELLVEEILRLQNTVCYLQAQLQEARKMNAQKLIHRMCAAPLVIQYEADDEIIHTDIHPFCDDPSCGCHDDVELIQEHLERPFDAGLLTSEEYFRVKEGKQL